MSEDARFTVLREEHQRRRMLQEEVAAAVRKQAATRNDHDELLAAFAMELRSRDLKIPPRPFLDVRLDMILGSDRIDQDLVTEQLKAVGEEIIGGLAELFGDEARDDKRHDAPLTITSRPQRKRERKGKPGSHRHQGTVLHVIPDERTTEVLLDEGAESTVASYEEPADEEFRAIPMLGPLAQLPQRVELGIGYISNLSVRRTSAEDVEVRLGGRRLGWLDQAAAAEFRLLLVEKHGGRRRSAFGIRHIDHEGKVHLWTYLPSPWNLTRP